MKAMILAAGRGERLRPLTDHLPKPLLPAGGQPLIAWHLQRLARAGIRDIVVNHAWLGEKIVAALGDGAAFGLTISYSAEDEALETAGGIAQAMALLTAPGPRAPRDTPGTKDGCDLLRDPFLVINGDTFCDFDLGRAQTIALQMAPANLACWCVMVPNPAHHPGGDFLLADGLLADGFPADGLHADGSGGPGKDRAPGSPAPARLTYAGIGLFTPQMFDHIERGRKSPLRPCLEREIAAGRAAGEYHGGLWFDIGTAQRLAELDRLLDSGSITVGARDG